METYSGWIRVNFGSSSLAPEKVVSFLLDEGKKIPTYNGPADLIDYTVSVAPAYVGMSDDFNTSIAVDNAEVKIEEQIM